MYLEKYRGILTIPYSAKTYVNVFIAYLFQYEDDFQVSVRMSTYLVAFIICNYSNITATTRNNIQISVYAPPTMINQAYYALNISLDILDYYQSFFDHAYPLPKLGMYIQYFLL